MADQFDQICIDDDSFEKNEAIEIIQEPDLNIKGEISISGSVCTIIKIQ
jgi:hypothetical protein